MRAVGPELRALLREVAAEDKYDCAGGPTPVVGADEYYPDEASLAEAISRGLIVAIKCDACDGKRAHETLTPLGRIALRLPQEQGVGA